MESPFLIKKVLRHTAKDLAYYSKTIFSHAFVPVNAIPSMNCFWNTANMTTSGRIAITEPAIIVG